MKKFLLSSALYLIISGAFAQTVCPTNAKRNNGNDCKNLPAGIVATGGGIEVEFPSAPNVQLQIALIIQNGATATVVESTKKTDTRAGKTFLSWCFETDNLDPVSQGSIQYQFYIDANNNNLQDLPAEASFLCSQATLPVTLANFDAAQKSGKVTLNWNTILELSNDGFEIERRIGNGTYQKIAFVDSKAPGGNGTAYSYSFDDNTALPKGVTYYRLKQIDFDGRSTYSEIRAVRSANGTLLLSVYPNPSRGTTNVAIPAGIGAVDVTLTDFTGKSLQQWNGLNTTNLQLTNLKAGMYTLRVNVRATGETITERIAVQ